jgi:hypothetical protein
MVDPESSIPIASRSIGRAVCPPSPQRDGECDGEQKAQQTETDEPEAQRERWRARVP